MHEQQGLDQLTDAILLRRTPANTGMRYALLMKDQEIRVEGDQHSVSACGECQLIGVRQTAACSFLSRQHVQTMPPQPLTYGTWNMLVHEKPDRLSHRSFPGVRQES